MKAIHFFYTGLVIDGLALLIALFFVFGDIVKGHSGTNNPTMYKAIFALLALMGVAVWLKSIGKIIFANILLWIPATPLAGYCIMILLFILFKPDMR